MQRCLPEGSNHSTFVGQDLAFFGERGHHHVIQDGDGMALNNQQLEEQQRKRR
jgi:hypothetical protein